MIKKKMIWLLLALSVVVLMGVTIAQPNVGWGAFLFVLREMILPNFIIILPLTLTMRYFRSRLNLVGWIVAGLSIWPIFFAVVTSKPIVSFLNGVIASLFPDKPWFHKPWRYDFWGINIQTWVWMISATLASVLLSLGFIATQRRLPTSKVSKGVIIRTKVIRWFYVALELLLWRWLVMLLVLWLLVLIFIIPNVS